MITLLIVLASVVAFFGFNNILWRIGLKYSFRMARNEFWEYHLLGLLYFSISFPDYDIPRHKTVAGRLGQRTIDKYDPKLADKKARKAEQKEIEYKEHITQLEIEGNMELTYPEYRPHYTDDLY